MRLQSPLSWIELSKSALNRNIHALSRLASGRQMAVSVKANAYGHGLPEIVGMLSECDDVAYVSVHSLEEAVACRKAGWRRRIMLLGPVASDSLEAVVGLDLEPVIFNRETLEGLGRLSKRSRKPILTHLKLETGTNRQGIGDDEVEAFARVYRKFPDLGGPYGASMHFANIEDTTNHEFAQHQLTEYRRLLKRLTQLGIKPKVRHTAASAALILFEETRFDLVRPGIAAYGHWPSKETYLTYRLQGGENKIFTPVLTWKTRITQLKKLAPDSFIGYGCTYRTTSATKLAILPVGYYDGYDRQLSNRAYVLVRGRRSPVRGRVCMNLTMVDVTDIKGVRLGDAAVLIGPGGDEYLPVEQLADWSQTINYEMLARLSPGLARKIVK
jgi:alanine racemase